jgi:hypothetical protein
MSLLRFTPTPGWRAEWMTGRIIVDMAVIESNEQKGLSGLFIAPRRWPIRLT